MIRCHNIPSPHPLTDVDYTGEKERKSTGALWRSQNNMEMLEQFDGANKAYCRAFGRGKLSRDQLGDKLARERVKHDLAAERHRGATGSPAKGLPHAKKCRVHPNGVRGMKR